MTRFLEDEFPPKDSWPDQPQLLGRNFRRDGTFTETWGTVFGTIVSMEGFTLEDGGDAMCTLDEALKIRPSEADKVKYLNKLFTEE